ncbi:Sulfotransferase family protein [Cognatiyoonia koreensis]|uniref:Sulfotransferase family protein n=1 Tax=Cognatiyoonia koreensis TaxID=364200 RepID=A0A1I0RM57_9RHOB|nr:sulfotransferase [Cognatiyoonia koreensis]SEW42047.1 Sulfotransferase family protein [Cognatiyoonia koreensis]
MFDYCFISYISRSGSTLLAHLLSDRFQVCVTPEGSFPAEMLGVNGFAPVELKTAASAASYLDALTSVSKLASWNIEPTITNSLPVDGVTIFQGLLRQYRDTFFPSDQMICYKGDPVMPWEITKALSYHRSAGAIVILRDPRAILHSQLNAAYAYRGGKFSHAVAQNAREWAQMVSAIEALADDPRVHVVRYEELVTDTDAALAKLAAFLEVRCRDKAQERGFADTIADEERHLHVRATEAPDASRLDAWRTTLDPRKQALLEQLIGEQMRRHGYQPDAPISISRLSVWGSVALDYFAKLTQAARRHGKTSVTNPHYFLQKVTARLKPRQSGDADG